MQPHNMALQAPLARAWASLPSEWQRPLALLGLAWAGNIALFFADWRAMALQWWDSSTYNHILLIPFILGWLISLRGREVLRISPQGWWPGLVLFGRAGPRSWP